MLYSKIYLEKNGLQQKPELSAQRWSATHTYSPCKGEAKGF